MNISTANMKSRCKMIRIFSSSRTYPEEQFPTISNFDSETKAAKHSRNDSMKEFRNNLSHGGIMNTGSVSETMKCMCLRKKIFMAGRVESLFRKNFPTVNKEEILLGAHKCIIFTTAGPIKGRIFITSERIAFQSRKLLKLKTYEGQVAKFPYKVSIPLRKIKSIVPNENLNRPEEKFVQIVTVDDFEFWFQGFVKYHKFFESLLLAVYREQ